MATIKDIAQRLGISAGTVSKGLNGAHDISEDLRHLILDTAVEMGYTTKRMKKNEYRKLCLFVENMSYDTENQFGYEIVLGFRQAAMRDDWNVEVIPATPDFQSAEKYDVFMLKNGFSGAFLVGFALQDPWMSQLSSTSIPTALFDNFIAKNPHVGYVGTDSFEGIELAVAHLVSLGHTKIALLNGSLNSMISEQRYQAFVNSMQFHGLQPQKALMAYGYYIADTAKYHVSHLLEAGATAILCGNDLIASGVIEECAKMGVSVPKDVSVIGYDDIPLAGRLTPALTTIRQDRIELGKTGYYMLSSLMKKVAISKMLLRPQLIKRASAAVCRK